MALIIVCGQFLTLAEATAELTTPVVAALATAGIGLGGRDALARLDGWAVGLALAAFAAFAAPIVLSGEATLAGYIKLDDTSTWMALTDRVMEHGRSLDGLAPSTYEAALKFNLADGYPIGVFLPLGATTLLSGQDVAWTIQPYMAALGAMLALALWQVAEPLVRSRPLRALAAFTGSQAALLYGYYLWGGIKEMAAAALIAAAAPLAMIAAERGGRTQTLVPLALAAAALIGVLSAGGALWLLVPLAAAVAILVRAAGVVPALRRAAVGTALVTVLSLPVLATGGLLPPTSSPLTSDVARGNLIEPLDLTRLAGIWPAGDFRVDPPELAPTYALVAVAIAAAAALLGLTWRRGGGPASLYVGGSLLAAIVIFVIGSPWVDGKALATASPAIPFAAALAGALLWASGRRVEGGALLVVITGGVLWSNALQYRDVNLAPRDQLAELEEIGERIQGQGPTLMTEYQPYGVRHFLRDADPEAASELRRREVLLTTGGTLPKGEYADTDRFQLTALTAYRTLVLRRGPDQSRPPLPYGLAWRGEYYEVWQRSDGPTGVHEHLGLGDGVSPTGRPVCSEVRDLAAAAGPDGRLAAAERPPVVVSPMTAASYPPSWGVDEAGERLIPRGPGQLTTTVNISRAAKYEVWLLGSVRPRVELMIDGEHAGTVRHQLNNAGLSVLLGAAELTPGAHEIEVRFDGSDLHPGSGGSAEEIGPLVLSDADAADVAVTFVSAAQAERRLCGRDWDWIEALE